MGTGVWYDPENQLPHNTTFITLFVIMYSPNLTKWGSFLQWDTQSSLKASLHQVYMVSKISCAIWFLKDLKSWVLLSWKRLLALFISSKGFVGNKVFRRGLSYACIIVRKSSFSWQRFINRGRASLALSVCVWIFDYNWVCSRLLHIWLQGYKTSVVNWGHAIGYFHLKGTCVSFAMFSLLIDCKGFVVYTLFLACDWLHLLTALWGTESRIPYQHLQLR